MKVLRGRVLIGVASGERHVSIPAAPLDLSTLNRGGDHPPKVFKGKNENELKKPVVAVVMKK